MNIGRRRAGMGIYGAILALSFPCVLAQDESLPIVDEVDAQEWGIRNGCISTRSIRNIDFHSDQAALITLNGGRKVMLQFRDRCPGIRYNGFVYQTSTGRLCAGFDRVRVLDSGWSCTIESFEPYPELVDDSSPERKGVEKPAQN